MDENKATVETGIVLDGFHAVVHGEAIEKCDALAGVLHKRKANLASRRSCHASEPSRRLRWHGRGYVGDAKFALFVYAAHRQVRRTFQWPLRDDCMKAIQDDPWFQRSFYSHPSTHPEGDHETTKPTKTISQLFEEFLATRRAGSAPRPSRNTRALSAFTDRIWKATGPVMTAKAARSQGRWHLLHTLRPEDVTGGLQRVLGLLLPRKVDVRQRPHASGCTVTKKCKVLAEKGYVEDTEMPRSEQDEAQETLPNAQAVLDILTPTAMNMPSQTRRRNPRPLHIDRIEPGKLWLNPLTLATR